MSMGVAGETSDSVIAIICKLGGDGGQKGAKAGEAGHGEGELWKMIADGPIYLGNGT